MRGDRPGFAGGADAGGVKVGGGTDPPVCVVARGTVPLVCAALGGGNDALTAAGVVGGGNDAVSAAGGGGGGNDAVTAAGGGGGLNDPVTAAGGANDSAAGGPLGGVLVAGPVEFPASVELPTGPDSRITGAPQAPQNRPKPVGCPQEVQNAPAWSTVVASSSVSGMRSTPNGYFARCPPPCASTPGF